MAEDYYNSSLTGDEIESRLLGAVVYNATQVIPEDRRVQARRNIGAMKDRDVDSLPKSGSTNLITSGGVYDAMGGVFSPTKLATPGALVHFEDGAYKKPLEALRLAIDPVQSGTGDPSPDNIRPITGWTGANVNVAGKNRFYTNLAIGSFEENGLTYTVQEDRQINVSGTATANTFQAIGYFTPQNGVSYILNGCPSGGSISTYRMTLITVGYDTGRGLTFTGAGTQLAINIDIYRDQTVNFTFKPMIRLASDTDSAFEPYRGTTYPISFGSAGTVYGGTLDVTTGKLTVTKKAVDMGTLAWTMPAASVFQSPTLSDAITPTTLGDEGSICSMFKRVVYPSGWANGKYVMCDSNYSALKRATVYDTTHTTAAAFKTAVTGQTLVYTLATPIEYDLTPTEVRTLLGENNIWADTGGIEELAYRADIGLYLVEALNPIKELIANREDTMRATKNYVTGDYIIVGNTLYKALTSIANGTSLTVNGNVRITTVGAELKTALQN